MPKSLHEMIARADELADAFEAYEPRDGDRGTASPVTVLKLAALRRAAAERDLAEAVGTARAARVSWAEIGRAVGTSGEAARQRYGRTTASS